MDPSAQVVNIGGFLGSGARPLSALDFMHAENGNVHARWPTEPVTSSRRCPSTASAQRASRRCRPETLRIPAANRPLRLFATPDYAGACLDSDFGSPADPYPRTIRSESAMRSYPKPALTPRMARLQAQKARRLASGMLSPEDRDRLLSYAREMDERAAELEAADPPSASLLESS